MPKATTRPIPEKEYLTIEQRKVLNWYRMVLQDKDACLVVMDLSDYLRGLEQYETLEQSAITHYFSEHQDELSELGKLLRISDVNDMALKLFGDTDKEAFLSRPLDQYIQDFSAFTKLLTVAILEKHQYIEIEATALELNQRAFKVSIKLITPVITDKLPNIVVSISCLSDADQLAIKLFEDKQVYESFVNHAPVCIHEIDQEGRLESMNAAGLNMMEVGSIDDIKGQYYLDFVDDSDRDRIGTLLDRAYDGYSSEFEFTLVVNDKPRVFTSCFIPMEKVDDGRRRIIGVTQDITDRKASEEELYRMANYDPLTELRNRTSFNDSLQQLVAQASRLEHSFALLFIDLDNFKPINDNYGHDIGDTILQEVSRRICNVLREEDIACRYGGDEFLILLPHIAASDSAKSVALKIMESLKGLVTTKDARTDLFASIGIGIFPHDGNTPKTLLAHADEAMYQAKRAGGNQIRFYAQR